MTDDRRPTFLGARISRRSMLGTSVFVGGTVLAGCAPSTERRIPDESSVLAPQREPTPPPDLRLEEGYLFFTDQEARTVEAIVARIVPGDDADPGALQAGVPVYIDRKLQDFEAFAEPTYHRGPFAVGYEEGQEPPAGADTVAVAAAQLPRYGFQSELTPQELYRAGLAGVDRLAQARSGSPFADLDAAAQDALLIVLESVQERTDGGSGSGGGPTDAELDQAEDLFGDADPGEFFGTVRTNTIEGMFCDPVYGGNRDLVGWTMIGWPGPQRSYSPREMLDGTTRQPSSLEGLPAMNPDRIDGGREALEKPRRGVHGH